MLDTVKVVLAGFEWPTGMDDEKWSLGERVVDGRFLEKYRLDTGKCLPELKRVKVWYDAYRRELVLEASLPGLAHGDNAAPLLDADVEEVVGSLDALVGWGLLDSFGMQVTSVPSVREWLVRRADLCFDYRPKAVPFTAALKVLVGLHPSRARLTAVRYGNTTAYYRPKGKRRRLEIAVYSKEHETKARKAEAEAQALAKGTIRVEVRLHDRQTVRAAFALHHPPRLADVLNREDAAKALTRKLALLDVKEGLESVSIGRAELAKRLGTRAANRLWPYREARRTMTPLEIAQEWGQSPRTVQTYERQLRKAGLFTATVSAAGVIEELAAAITAAGKPTSHAVSPLWIPSPTLGGGSASA